jgi:hypothetical protein
MLIIEIIYTAFADILAMGVWSDGAATRLL